MTKEDKQIIDRAVKEEWRLGDRSHLKRLLKKNLEQYRENVELKNKIADLKANCDLAIEGRDVKIKELEEENNKFLDVISNYEVKIADLEKQIEKMKCCGNCEQRELIREHGQWKERFNCKGNGCVCYNKWRLKNE